MIGGIEEIAGYVGYCCADQISRLKLVSMAKEFKLDVEGCAMWWVDVKGENKGLKEIHTNMDALSMENICSH